MTQKNRIAAYLDTVMEKSMSEESQSMIFAVDAAQVAGDNGTCTQNEAVESCGAGNTNNKCTNIGAACKGGANGECTNPPSTGSDKDNSCSYNFCKEP